MMTIVYGFGIAWLLVVGVILVAWAYDELRQELRLRRDVRELVQEIERV